MQRRFPPPSHHTIKKGGKDGPNNRPPPHGGKPPDQETAKPKAPGTPRGTAAQKPKPKKTKNEGGAMQRHLAPRISSQVPFYPRLP